MLYGHSKEYWFGGRKYNLTDLVNGDTFDSAGIYELYVKNHALSDIPGRVTKPIGLYPVEADISNAYMTNYYFADNTDGTMAVLDSIWLRRYDFNYEAQKGSYIDLDDFDHRLKLKSEL